MLPPLREQPEIRHPYSVYHTYEPVPPYRIHVWKRYPFRVLWSEDKYNLNAAMKRFAAVSMPPQYDQHAWLMDSQLMMVFGYALDDWTEETYGPGGLWMGCRAGYAAAERLEIMDRLDLALCEGMAEAVVDRT